MKTISFCFVLTYLSIFAYHAIPQVTGDDGRKAGDGQAQLKFKKFEIAYRDGKLNFEWDVSDQSGCRYFVIEKRDGKNDFKVVALAFPFENNQDSVYKYFERPGKKRRGQRTLFRIKAQMENGPPVYSNIVYPVSR